MSKGDYMELNDFRLKAQEIRSLAEKEVRKLGKEFAFSKASAKIGDTVTCKFSVKQSLIVDDIKFSMRNYLAKDEKPECVYFGLVLTKTGKLRKDGLRSRIYESDLLK